MNTARIRKPLLLALPAVLAILFYAWWSQDIRVVQRRFDALTGSISRKSGENPAMGAVRVNRALAFFDAGAVIDPGPPFRSRLDRTELKAILLSARQRAAMIRVRALGYECERTAPGEIRMSVTVEAEAEINGYRDSSLGTYEVRWMKSEGEWLITSVAPLEVVKHPGQMDWM